MVSMWFVCLVGTLILLSCALLAVSEIAAAKARIVAWLDVFLHHPRRALRVLWDGFWNSWTAVAVVATTLIAFIFDPQLLGSAATKVMFLAAMLIIFVKICIAEEIHGEKGKRRDSGTRISAVLIMFLLLAVVSFLMCGALENSKRGRDANWSNIWAASLWWVHPHAQTRTSQQRVDPEQQSPPTKQAPEIVVPKPTSPLDTFENVPNAVLSDIAKDYANMLRSFSREWDGHNRNDYLSITDYVYAHGTDQQREEASKKWAAKQKQNATQQLKDGKQLIFKANQVRLEIVKRCRLMGPNWCHTKPDSDADALFKRLLRGEGEYWDVDHAAVYLNSIREAVLTQPQ